MIVTKEHQEALVEKYVKDKHNQDECIGFIDGLNAALDLVKNLTIPDVSNTEVRGSVCPNCFDNKVLMHKGYNKETCVKCGFHWQTDC